MKVRQRHNIVHVSSKVRSMEGRTSSSEALDGRTQQGESDGAAQPVYGGTVSSLSFLRQQRGEPFVKYRSLFAHVIIVQ